MEDYEYANLPDYKRSDLKIVRMKNRLRRLLEETGETKSKEEPEEEEEYQFRNKVTVYTHCI